MNYTTKHLVTLFALILTVSVNAQWAFNPSSLSTTMGNQTTASDYASLAIGHFNTDDTTPNPGSFSLENRAFIIGNGTDASNKSDAMTVLFDGTTTIAGTVIAKSFRGESSMDLGFETEAIGPQATAMGVQTNASGGVSTAMGQGTTASREGATAMGGQTIASAGYATAMGWYTTASGAVSTAMGSETLASGPNSTAMGEGTSALGDRSTAMGFLSGAAGEVSTAMGFATQAQGDYSMTMGYATIAQGDISTTMGNHTIASDYASLAIGHFNTDDTTPNPGSFSLENRAFIIGNGTDASNKSDAMTVLFDGTTTIAGTVTATSFIGDGSLLTNLPSASDNQQLSLDGNNLTLEDGGSVDLSVLGNSGADDQQLTITGNNLNLEDGGTVDLSAFDNSGTDDQQLTITGNNLNLEDGGTVDLSAFDNSGTDDQQLTITGNNLNLEEGGTVDLSDFLDNTDDQNISGSVLTGTTLTIAIEGGTSENIDLNPLLVNLQSQIDAQQIIIDDLIARMIIREDCKCNKDNGENKIRNSNNSIGDGNSKTPSVSAFLINNIPNPFENSTSIGYFVPIISTNANLVISTSTGQILKNIKISKFGKGSVVINKDNLNAAIYYYTLYVDGKQIDSKKMIVK